MPSAGPVVSVIVPVFNQWDLLPALVDCVKAQSLPEKDFELLLIDNGSDCVPVLDDEFDFARCLSCSAPGSYAARNYGAAYARGKFFVFTDADCRPRRDWLRELIGSVSPAQSANTVVAGAVAIVPRNREDLNAVELYDTVMGIPQALYVKRGYGVTANLMVPAAAFGQLGGFDARRFSGGDAEFCRRATAAGFQLRYCSTAVVDHPARVDMQSLITKARRIKGGQLGAGPVPRRLQYGIRTFLPPVRAWSRAARAPGWTCKQRTIVCIVQARLWLAELSELFRLLLGKQPERR